MKKFSNEEKMEVLVEKMKREGATTSDINCIREFEFGKIYTFDKINSVLFRHRVNPYNFMVYFSGAIELSLREELITDDLIMKYISEHEYLSQVLYNKYNVKELVSIDKISGEHIYINCIKRNDNFVERKTINLKSLLDNLEKYDNNKGEVHNMRREFSNEEKMSILVEKLREMEIPEDVIMQIQRFEFGKEYNSIIIEFPSTVDGYIIRNLLGTLFKHLTNAVVLNEDFIKNDLILKWIREYPNIKEAIIEYFDGYLDNIKELDVNKLKIENNSIVDILEYPHEFLLILDKFVKYLENKEDRRNRRAQFMERIESQTGTSSILNKSSEEALRKLYDTYGIDFIINTINEEFHANNLSDFLYMAWRCYCNSLNISHIDEVLNFDLYSQDLIDCDLITKVENKTAFTEKNNLHTYRFNVQYLVSVINKKLRGDNVMQNKTVVDTVKNNTKIMKDVFDKVVKEDIQIILPEEALKKQCEVYGFNNVVNFITKTLECAVSTGDLDIRFYEGWKYRIKHSPINDVTDIIAFRVYIKGDIYISNLLEIDDANPFMELYSLKFNIWYLVQIISKEFEKQQFKINDISDKSTPNVVEQIITYMLFNSLSGYRFSSHKYNLNDYDIDKLKKLGFEVEKSYNSIGTGYIVKKK